MKLLLDKEQDQAVPLCVDLDGTLIKSDLLFETFLLLVNKSPILSLRVAVTLLTRGRAAMKRRIAESVTLDCAELPYRTDVLDWLRKERAKGRPMVLATASDALLANQVAAYLGLFDDVIGSDGCNNLKGSAKAKAIVSRYPMGFDYIGDSITDRPIWALARRAVVVAERIQPLSDTQTLSLMFGNSSGHLTIRRWASALRVHQWAKNFLIFVPLITSHRVLELGLVSRASLLFVSLSLCASAMYILNDLLDVWNDRAHPTKRRRPFASGDLLIRNGILAMVMCLVASLSIAAMLGVGSLAIICAYGFSSGFYSMWLKRLALIDVFVLAGLYTMRIVAGGIVTEISLTGWLLGFSTFLFLSLAFCKRTAELTLSRHAQSKAAPRGRGYREDDLFPIFSCGVASAFTSSLILGLYLNSAAVRLLYSETTYLWPLVGACVFWQVRMLFITWRGEMTDDPVSFAIKDKLTYILAGVSGALMLLASFTLA